MSRFLQILWKNEYVELNDILGGADGKNDVEDKGGKVSEPEVKDDNDTSSPETDNKVNKKGKGVSNSASVKDDLNALTIDISKILVRYPSPATLNMSNLSDAINQGQPVAEFISDIVGVGEEDDVKAELKKRVIKDLMPQIHWDRYDAFLLESKSDDERKKAIAPSAGGDTAAPADDASSDTSSF